MMKKVVSAVLAWILAASSSIAVFAEDEAEEVTQDYATGLAYMSDEQWANFNKKLPMITDIKPNEIALSRSSEESQIALFSNISDDYLIADLGEEMSYALPGDSSSGGSVAPSAFPLSSVVDVSESLTFPPIANQGNIQSCVAWSLGYYQLTNNNCVVRGLKAKTSSGAAIEENIMSPRFIYTLINGGKNVATYYDEACAAIMSYGCPNVDDYSSNITENNLDEWCTNTETWNNAIYNKPQKISYGRIDNDEVVNSQTEGVVQIKKILSNGYVVTVPTFVDSFNYTNRTSDGEYGCRYMSDTQLGAHAMTIVGYDDRLWVDINNNRRHDSGETGAFKIANSWGTKVANYTDGYVWMPYDALGDVSAVSGASSNREGAFSAYYYIEPQKEYTPLLVAEVEMQTKNRNQVVVNVGVSDKDATSPEEKISVVNYNIAFNKAADGLVENKLDRNFSGGRTEQKISIPFDLTPVIKKAYDDIGFTENTELKIYIELADEVDTDSTVSLGNVEIVEPITGKSVECSDTQMLVANNSSVIKTIDFQVTPFVGYDNVQDITLVFSSNVQADSVADNIYLIGPDNQMFYPEYNIFNNKITIYPPDDITGYSDDTKYELHIDSSLKSQGGNLLSSDRTILLYILDEYYVYW